MLIVNTKRKTYLAFPLFPPSESKPKHVPVPKSSPKQEIVVAFLWVACFFVVDGRRAEMVESRSVRLLEERDARGGMVLGLSSPSDGDSDDILIIKSPIRSR